MWFQFRGLSQNTYQVKTAKHWNSFLSHCTWVMWVIPKMELSKVWLCTKNLCEGKSVSPHWVACARKRNKYISKEEHEAMPNIVKVLVTLVGEPLIGLRKHSCISLHNTSSHPLLFLTLTQNHQNEWRNDWTFLYRKDMIHIPLHSAAMQHIKSSSVVSESLHMHQKAGTKLKHWCINSPHTKVHITNTCEAQTITPSSNRSYLKHRANILATNEAIVIMQSRHLSLQKRENEVSHVMSQCHFSDL